MSRRFLWLCGTLAGLLALRSDAQTTQSAWRPVRLKSKITRVQPMTGIVLWATSAHVHTDAIQLEYSYVKYSDVVKQRGKYDWSKVNALLDQIAQRGHQAILRFYYVYPGFPTTVPDYIKALPDYRETRGITEGKTTYFPDWSHPELQRFMREFYQKFAAQYDADPRVAFLQTGFGLWAEYHIYDGPMQLGKTFPAKTFQADFARHLAQIFRRTPWMISVDAASEEVAPFAQQPDLRRLRFGIFDDSFLCKQHAQVNEENWKTMGWDRWKTAPTGGEFSYYTDHDQRMALAPNGPYGTSFRQNARKFHLTFMIGNDQPRYQPMARIRKAGLDTGYRFRILKFETNGSASRITITNRGVAPIYYDAFLAVNGVRAAQSLKGLLPGETRVFTVASGGAAPKLSVACDRLVPGQRIEYEADL